MSTYKEKSFFPSFVNIPLKECEQSYNPATESGNTEHFDPTLHRSILAQTGLTYTKDAYDRERYEQLREISAEMLAEKTDFSIEKVKDLFCNETGYQTPKLDTRAAIFENNKRRKLANIIRLRTPPMAVGI